MALINLNIYNDDDEIIKTYTTNRVRWGVLIKAVEMEEKINGDVKAAETINAISELIVSIFPSMTPDDLAMADFNDMKNTIRMVVNLAGHIEKNG